MKRTLLVGWLCLAACKSTSLDPPREQMASAASDAGGAASPVSAPANDDLPGPELRARLDPMATCWRRGGAPTSERPWRRNGGLCNRTFLRADASGELSLSMVFPQGPDGPIRATEGFARFRAARDNVDVTLFVRVSGATSPSVTRLEVGDGSTTFASLALGKRTKVTTAADLAEALGKVIDEDHAPARKDFSKRQDCKVLPNRGQQCEWVATTAPERARMAEDLAAEANRKRDWVAKNRDVIHALRNALYPFDDATCAALVTAE